MSLVRSSATFAVLVACCLPATPALSAAFRYEGVCEASAAVRLDDRHFAVASDETDDLTIYERNKAAPVGHLKHPGVTDIEASTRIDDTVFWLTSHSLNKRDKDKDERKVLFATRVVNGALKAEGRDFRDLRAKLATVLGKTESDLAAQLNIEGLAATAEGELLVGLRGPLDNAGRALMVKVENPFALVGAPSGKASGASTIKTVSSLDLQNRGVRSIERAGSGEHSYLVVAGSVLDGGLPPLLFWWDGANAISPGPVFDLGGVVPEAMIVWDEHHAQLLGDNGDACSDEEKNPRWFPSVEIEF